MKCNSLFIEALFKGSLSIMMAFALASHAFADSPLPAPEPIRVCSLNGMYCANSDPETNLTTITKKGVKLAIGSIAGWYRWILVSNEGNIVIGHSELNLVPTDIKLSDAVFYFYKKDRLIKTVTLGALYKSKSQLRPTMSHYAWINGSHLDAKNYLNIELIDGRKIKFDTNTGLVVKK